ncbi:MAG: hypothetical protein U1E74_03785 [Paenacidovorax caeni]
MDDVSEKMSVGPRVLPPLAGVLALPLESGDSLQGDTPRLASLRVFYKQLWQGIAERRNDGSISPPKLAPMKPMWERCTKIFRSQVFSA